ncbi:hypothetical protein RUM43_009991 [Polyplax serrata]|uniref:Uncharacterized protein n=1 Tax=Polyplax serrata TaxID=468196 RepID=A0AAN8PV85_POLSC
MTQDLSTVPSAYVEASDEYKNFFKVGLEEAEKKRERSEKGLNFSKFSTVKKKGFALFDPPGENEKAGKKVFRLICPVQNELHSDAL